MPGKPPCVAASRCGPAAAGRAWLKPLQRGNVRGRVGSVGAGSVAMGPSRNDEESRQASGAGSG